MEKEEDRGDPGCQVWMTTRGNEGLLRAQGGLGLQLGFQGHLSCFWHVEWVRNRVGRQAKGTGVAQLKQMVEGVIVGSFL